MHIRKLRIANYDDYALLTHFKPMFYFLSRFFFSSFQGLNYGTLAQYESLK